VIINFTLSLPLNIFKLYLRSVKRRNNDDTKKINICFVNSISISQTNMAAIQHPAVKKININAGIINSTIKKATPTRNHISDGEKIIFHFILRHA